MPKYRKPIQRYRPGLTESQAIKRFARADLEYETWRINRAVESLANNSTQGGWSYSFVWSSEGQRLKRKLRKKIYNKRRQPDRHKERAPLRARAKGKNEVRPCRGIR